MVVEPTVPQLLASQDILVGFLGQNNLLEKFTEWMTEGQAVIILATSPYMSEANLSGEVYSQAFDDPVNALEMHYPGEMAGVDEN